MKILFTPALLVFATSLFAGGIQQNTNQSAAYLRTLTRGTSTGTDAPFYNPAGTVFSKEGFHVNVNNQFVFQKTTAKPNAYPEPGFKQLVDQGKAVDYEKKYDGDTAVFFAPTVHLNYRWRFLSVFAAFDIIGGGGSRTYDKGIPTFHYAIASPKLAGVLKNKIDNLAKRKAEEARSRATTPGQKAAISDDVYMYEARKNTREAGSDPNRSELGADFELKDVKQKFEGSSAYLAETFGMGYRPIDELSFALGGVAIQAKNTRKGFLKLETHWPNLKDPANLEPMKIDPQKFEVEFEDTGYAYGVFFGTHYRPIEEVNLALKYEWYSKLELNRNNKKDKVAGFFEDDMKTIATLPQRISLGVDYAPASTLTLLLNSSIYLNSIIDEYKEEGFSTGFEVSFATEYQIIPEFLWSVGTLYSHNGGDEKTRNEVSPNLNSISFATGGLYTIIEGLSVELGLTYTQYLTAKGLGFAPSLTNNAEIVEMQRKGLAMALAVNYSY